MYFITICVKDKECIFGSISNGEMILNNIGHIVAHEWRNTSEIRDNVAIHDFIIMPNHLHGIIEITYLFVNNHTPVVESICGDICLFHSYSSLYGYW